jgi:hypothetical protein
MLISDLLKFISREEKGVFCEDLKIHDFECSIVSNLWLPKFE